MTPNAPTSALGANLKVLGFAFVASFVLTIVTWIIFFLDSATTQAPLNLSETTFVFACWFGLACFARWLWLKFRSRRQSLNRSI
jgi:apolipoprotein N-acyltransferase